MLSQDVRTDGSYACGARNRSGLAIIFRTVARIMRQARQLRRRSIQVAAENRAPDFWKRLEVGRHLTRTLGWRASAVQMRNPTVNSSPPKFTLVTSPVGVPFRVQRRGASTCAGVRGLCIATATTSSNGAALRIALPMYSTISPSRTRHAELGNVRAAHLEHRGQFRRQRRGRRDGFVPALTSHSRITSASLSGGRLRHFDDVAESLPASGVEQHDSQPRLCAAAPRRFTTIGGKCGISFAPAALRSSASRSIARS